MIRIPYAQAQLERLLNTPFFPTDRRGQRELMKALFTSATEEILASTVEAILETCDHQVTVALIRAIVAEKNVQHQAVQISLSRFCPVCSGSGFEITKGRYRFGFNDDGTPRFIETTGARRCVCGSHSPATSDCKRCQGCGLYGGVIGGKYDGPWKWCLCPAGELRLDREMEEIARGLRTLDSVQEGNAARELLMRSGKEMQYKFGSKRKGAPPVTPQNLLEAVGYTPKEDEYHGEF